MDQIKPVLGRRGLRASCWKVTITATVVGGVTALYLGILLGECIARHVHLLQKNNGLHSSQQQFPYQKPSFLCVSAAWCHFLSCFDNEHTFPSLFLQGWGQPGIALQGCTHLFGNCCLRLDKNLQF